MSNIEKIDIETENDEYEVEEEEEEEEKKRVEVVSLKRTMTTPALELGEGAVSAWPPHHGNCPHRENRIQ